MCIRAQGATYVATYLEVDSTITGVDLFIQRESDGQFLDFNDLTFKPAGHTSPSRALTESTPPGESQSIWRDATGWVLPAVNAAYVTTLKDSTGVLIPGERVEAKETGISTFDPALDAISDVINVSSVTNPVTVGTNNDKAGYALSASGIDAIWDELQTGHTVPGSFGLYLDALVSAAGGGGLTAQQIATAVWAENIAGGAANSANQQLFAIRNSTSQLSFKQENGAGPFRLEAVLADGILHGGPNASLSLKHVSLSPNAAQTVAGNNDFATVLIEGQAVSPVGALRVTGFATNQHAVELVGNGTGFGISGTLSDLNTIAAKVWDELQAGHTTAGSFGFYLDALVSAAGGGSLTVQQIVDGVWNELKAGHTTANSFGDFVDSKISLAGGGSSLTQQQVRDSMMLTPTAGAPGALSVDEHLDVIINRTSVDIPNQITALNDVAALDVWDVLETAVLTTSSMGLKVKANLDVVLSSRQPSGVVALAAGQVVQSVTDPVTVTGGGTLTAGERAAIADALLDRDMATGADSGTNAIRTVRQALRANRNKLTIAGGILTVTKEDDATASHTATVTTAAGDPIVGIDPA